MADPHNDEFMALSQFTVMPGREDSVAEAFRQRPHLVDRAPGFIRMEVFRPEDSPREFWLMTWWRDRVSYENWHNGHHYLDSHAFMPKGLKLVPRTAKVTHLRMLCR
ncbi:MAG: antibiotic biosynthesis monooxygenase [Proteobacteria bacterium]|nr:antibiotic biosynthesis monooxygenase [Pseudomonadota bacterium]